MARELGIRVVPLQVRIGDRVGGDGVDIGPEELVAALAVRRGEVSTSRPTPAQFASCFTEALEGGADEVVAVLLSRGLSGTWDAARLAAKEVDEQRVRVVDSRSTAMGLGYAVLAAVDAAGEGANGVAVEEAAAAVAARSRVIFCLETLEFLRRGGRIGPAAALLGTALAVRPLLHVTGGRILPLEKVRTTSRAVSRLVELAVQAAGRGGADLAVHHLGAEQRAADLAKELTSRLPDVRRCLVAELGAAIGAHCGPGVLGVVVVPPA
jgi:DegV family protein with EDD domain